MKLDDLTAEQLNTAVELYLEHAYDQADAREKKRIVFRGEDGAEALLAQFEVETEDKPDAHRSYVLRLGSQDYPHMKLALQEAFHRGEFVIAVDSHDGFRFDKDTPGYEEWLELKNQNRQRRLRIEDAWFEAGLPTMRSLKQTLLSRSEVIRSFRGYHVLLVDDDADAAVIIRMILQAAGFRCLWVRSVAEAVKAVREAKRPYAVAFIDIVMNDGDGLDVVKTLRNEPKTQDALVYFTSAMNRAEVDESAVDGYLRKPFNAAELTAIVEEGIGRIQGDGAEAFLDPGAETEPG